MDTKKSKEELWEEFATAMFAFDDIYSDFENVREAFESPDVKMLFELAVSAYLKWKNYV